MENVNMNRQDKNNKTDEPYAEQVKVNSTNEKNARLILNCQRRLYQTARGLGFTSIFDKLKNNSMPENFDSEYLLKCIDECDQYAENILQKVLKIRKAINLWCRTVIISEVMAVVLITSLLLVSTILLHYWSNETLSTLLITSVQQRPFLLAILVGLCLVAIISFHFTLRRNIAIRIKSSFVNEQLELGRSFERNTFTWRSLFRPQPIGWHWIQQRKFNNTRADLMRLRTHISTAMNAKLSET